MSFSGVGENQTGKKKLDQKASLESLRFPDWKSFDVQYSKKNAHLFACKKQ